MSPLRPPPKPRSQSATEGMAARGGLGPTSPTSPISPIAQTYSMSPTITLERQATVKFDDATRSLDIPRSPMSQKSETQQTRHRKESKRTQITGTATNDASSSWFTRLFGRRGKDEVEDESKEYP